jgi:hypothetical protein
LAGSSFLILGWPSFTFLANGRLLLALPALSDHCSPDNNVSMNGMTCETR